MEDINIINNKSVSKVMTTVTVRNGTRHDLMSLAKKGESFDDVISRLVHTLRRLESENEALKARLKSLNALDVNRIELGNIERTSDVLRFSDGMNIVFDYNLPIIPTEEGYVMDIEVENVLSGNKKLKFDTVAGNGKKKAMLKLQMVAKVINRHFDPAFEMPSRNLVIDPVYWKKIYERVGLPMSSYTGDILPIISEYEGGLNG